MDTEVLEAGVRRLGIPLTSRQIEQFRQYHRELLAWNQRVNLTAVTEWAQVQRVHFQDSLTVSWALSAPVCAQGCLIDVGAGAGFPGLPLKIAYPALRVTLVESVGKKARFLEHLVESLGLSDVTIYAERAETLAHRAEVRDGYDVAVSRALGSLSVALELTLPFCRMGGVAVVQKKGSIGGELDRSRSALQALGGRLREIQPVLVEGLQDDRVLVVVEKTASTPGGYPRRTGMPRKRPL